MKRKLAMLTASAMVMSATGSVYADGENKEGLWALQKEISEVQNAKIVETMKMTSYGDEITITVEADCYDGAIGNVNVTAGMNADGMEMSVSVEDVFRYIPGDAAYINIGGIFDMISELAGEDMSEMESMFGLTEDWVAVYSADLPSIEAEQLEAFTAAWDTYAKSCLSYAGEDAFTAIEGGYQFTLDESNVPAMTKGILSGLEEQSNDMLTSVSGIIAGMDVQPFLDSYVAAIVDALAEADETFDRDMIMEEVNEIPAMLSELAEMMNPEMITLLLEEEGIELDDMEESLDELDDVEIPATMTGHIVKLADGSFEAGYTMQVVEEEEEAVSTEVKATIQPNAAAAVTAPESSQDLKVVLSNAIKDNYEMLSLIMLSLMMDDDDWDDDDWDDTEIDGTDDGDDWDDWGSASDDSVVFEGNRVHVMDYWDINSFWVTFDDTKLSLDIDYSTKYNIYLDIVDTYDFISFGASENDLAATYESEASWYMDEDYYQNTEVGELTAIEGTDIQYAVLTYTSNEEDYTTLFFGMDADDACVYGTYDVNEYSLSMEDVLAILPSVFVSVEE